MQTVSIIGVVLVTILGCCSGAPTVYPGYETHVCKRNCVGAATRDCYYEFNLEWWWSMDVNCGACANGTTNDCYNTNCVIADGNQRQMLVYNRRLHGPQVEVCEGDRIIFDIVNRLDDVETTVHFHGMHQIGTNHYDGVPFITQCPVHHNNIFRYTFTAYPSGTHWIHSHMGFQRVTGAYAPLIVRPRTTDPQASQYDYDLSEHVLTITEWQSMMPQMVTMRYMKTHIFDLFMTNIVISGIGNTETSRTPAKRFTVTRGYRYRFRLIGAANTVCPIRMRIDGHQMKVIAADGYSISPEIIDELIISPGERLDIVITATAANMLYYMRFYGMIDCEGVTGRAVLAYSGATSYYTTVTTGGRVFNCINAKYNAANCVSYAQTRSLTQLPADMSGTPAFKYWFVMDTYDDAPQPHKAVRDWEVTSVPINNLTFAYPPSNMLQDYSTTPICNWENTGTCRSQQNICSCTHAINVPANSLIEFIFVDEACRYDLSHPIHLHGYSFKVIGQDRVGPCTKVATLRNMDANGQLVRNYDRPVSKDTAAVPAGGYLIFRFMSNNQGIWFLHCHVEHHAEEGMALALIVGTPTAPPSNFPRCGNYYG